MFFFLKDYQVIAYVGFVLILRELRSEITHF
jgi:hypothetical protein